MSDRARVLLVDDDAGCRELLRRACGSLGLDAVLAEGAAQARERLSGERFDVVVTDVCMESEDAGVRLAEETERLQPGVPVILLTGQPELGTAVPALRAGACDYLLKPFKLAELDEALSRARRRASGPRPLREELLAAYGELDKVERLRQSTLAIINHELRTPLGAALLAAERLPADAGTERLRGILRDSLERLQGTVEDFLLHARLGAAAAPASPEPVDFAALVGDCALAARAEAERRGQRLRLEAAGAGGRALAEPAALRRAVEHLLDNAIRFNREGGEVAVTLALSERAASLTVADQGPGLPDEERDRIFDPYYQVAGFLTREHGGAGLGLAIVRRVFESAGGSVSVAGSPGEGCRFTALLPLKG